MRTKLVLKPGEAGTMKLVEKYGDRLVRVRYRYDEESNKRYKTVELIEDEANWVQVPAAEAIMLVEVIWGELELAQKIKRRGGRWNADHKGWELPYFQVVEMGLEERVMYALEA